MISKNIRLIINRIVLMSFKEIIFRFISLIFNFIRKNIGYHIRNSVHNATYPMSLFVGNFSDINQQHILNEAELITSGNLSIFSLHHRKINGNINYHMNYKANLTSSINGISFNYKTIAGDIKYIWELNRLQFLLPLCLAYKFTSNRLFLNTFEKYLSEWFKQNPFPKGVNWSSTLELSIRLINWAFCWNLVFNSVSTVIKKKWVESIYLHCKYICNNFSRFSSANNHLIGEASGLFVACLALPQFQDSKKWLSVAFDILVNECLNQNYSDGVNKEQSVSYQSFVLNFFLISSLVGNRYCIEFPEKYWNRLYAMLLYLNSIKDLSGNFPKFGDGDDGVVIDLGQKIYGISKSVLNCGALLLNNPKFLNDDYIIDNNLSFLKLLVIRSPITVRTNNPENKANFNQGGYYILGDAFNTSREQKLIFDCGPLGYKSIAAHGHADCLSFHFSASGNPIFIDPGTYAYHNNPEWRNYFRSTRAHNTITINNANQSIIAGDFMWSYKAFSKLIDYKNHTYVQGMHKGYCRLKSKVIHFRSVMYNKELRIWSIIDELRADSKYIASIYYHLHPNCVIRQTDNYFEILFNGGKCFLSFEDAFKISVYYGNYNPISGWFSPSYDKKVPSYTIKCEKEVLGTKRIVTFFKIKFD